MKAASIAFATSSGGLLTTKASSLGTLVKPSLKPVTSKSPTL
jgi:hypothetical protein